jgi:hypothetical protein
LLQVLVADIFEHYRRFLISQERENFLESKGTSVDRCQVSNELFTLKYVLEAARTILWQFKNRPSAIRIKSVKVSSLRKLKKEEESEFTFLNEVIAAVDEFPLFCCVGFLFLLSPTGNQISAITDCAPKFLRTI